MEKGAYRKRKVMKERKANIKGWRKSQKNVCFPVRNIWSTFGYNCGDRAWIGFWKVKES